MPKVSIVLPSYNGEKYIREAIESVIGQTFTDWELIIVDDCSNDNTCSIAQEYVAKDARISLIHNEINQKLPASLNIGFRATVGVYLTWTSDDNIYKPYAIEEMYRFIEDNSQYKMICADMSYIDDAGNPIDMAFSFDDIKMHYNNCVGACFLYHREVLEKVGEYDETAFCVEDYDYWLRIMQHYGNIGYLKKNLYLYRIHGGSLSSSKKKMIREQLLRLRFKNMDWLLKGLVSRNDLLWKMYYEFYSVGNIGINLETIKVAFSAYLPLGEMNSGIFSLKNKVVIFGAGYWGSICRKILGERAICFVDNNKEKEGECLEGTPVVHASSLHTVIADSKILIAVSPETVYEVFCGIKKEYRNRVIVCHEIIGQELFNQMNFDK